ncbi:MAG: acetolactate synthase small subunit [Acidobacteria bacterium]|nr:MAG: acetolactate synthase small subunit [Acidobacteriota bacterium]
MVKLHTFTVYVEDRPGVLNRVASLFRRRGFNIQSLSVGHSETAGVSRMTVVVETDDSGAARIKAHVYKLINVVRVEDITDRPSVVRDLALIKVSANHQNRAAVMQLANVFHARVVDVAPESLVVEMVGSEAKIDGLLEVLRPYGVLEMVRTGRVAMARGSGAGVAAGGGRFLPEAEEGFSYSV